ncbi:hypothetical protein [Opitutus sp. GAS368]|uniref:hypothetical protein n=1 Tax=Opitutus sp. GAS368 TaxID=1882749 RepID=UPI00087AE123|nr:hypothetical protein [Opitutus sp. GAS368]SDS21783.1 hypothetical protein SAMN05444173_2228 [Opitutus sp. GAS368]
MKLPDHETLQAVGVTLAMAGVILRGFAGSARRDLARRKEHRIDERRSTDAILTGELAKPPGWFERNLGLVANVILVTGVVITVVGFSRS